MVDILINDTTRTTPMVNLNLPNIDITIAEAYEDQGGKLGPAHLSTVHYVTYDFNIFVMYTVHLWCGIE